MSASYDALKGELKEIVDLVETLPERYKDRCFDVLLTELLTGHQVGDGGAGNGDGGKGGGGGQKDKEKSAAPPVKAKVRAFMTRNGLSDDDLKKLVLVEAGELHFIQEPEVQQNSTGQIQWSLLLALKSGLLTGEIEVDAEGVRSVCIEKGLYDKGNFASNFKTAKNASLFQSAVEPHGSSVKLSTAGEKRLAELVKSLTS